MDVNRAWKKTCEVILGDDVGELGDFERYLKKNNELLYPKKSVLSGKEVTISDEEFCPTARFISNDEVEQFEKTTDNVRLDLNEIKDIDSILHAFSEKFAYAGGVVLGNCKDVESSHRCIDCFFVKGSHEMTNSRYAAYSTLLRDCEHVFGCSFTGEAKFGIKCTQFFQSSRCFEVILTMLCSDCYYTANMEGCQNCMFSFNLKKKNHCIGNLELPKDKYFKIKAGLVEQIRNEIEAKKDIMGIVELLLSGKGKPGIQIPKKLSDVVFTPSKPPQNELEKAFSETTSILFGKRLTNLADYQDWLFRHTRKPLSCNSAKSGKLIHVTPVRAYLSWHDAALSNEEAWELGKHSILESQIENLSISNAKEALTEISFSTPELIRGKNRSVEDSVNYFDSEDCYGGAGYYATKKSAYGFYIRECENVFGCELVYYSKFCLKCYHSINLTRCFEVSDSKSSSDCYFCHNVENVHDSLFCFNTKAKRYAIGNIEIGREAYAKIKKSVLDGIARKLEKDKRLDLDIYNGGCSSHL